LGLAMTPAIGQDVEGSSDHPLVGRFTGSTIIYYKASADEQAALLQAPHDYGSLLDRNALSDRSGTEWLPVEGRVTKIRYEMPAGHGSLEVSKSYRAALEAKGFSVLYECADAECLTGTLADDYLLGQQLDTDNSDTARYSTHVHYFLAALGASPEPAGPTDPGGPTADIGGPGTNEPDMDAGGPGSPADMGGPGSPTDMGGPGSPTDMGGPGSPTDMGGPGSPPDMGGPGSPTDMGGPGSPEDTGLPNSPTDVGGPGSPDTDAGPGMDGTPPTAPCADPVDLVCASGQVPPAPTARAYVAILVGEDQALTTAFVEVVEPASGDGDLANNVAVVDAQQMATQLGDGGSVNIYGLHFDTGSATLRPDSRATLEQIFQLLQSQPQLRLAVVGHTDNQGGANYNMQLSTQRAQSVVASLVGDYGVAAGRLEPSGRGYTQPVASNDTEDGRAQNRRVELIALPPAPGPSSAVAAVDTTIYAKPAGKEVGYLRAGEPVTIVSCDDIGWCNVTAPQTGYVWGPDLSK
jgi:outer membrane protein OmpA-like peptidoglycan-associated protein